MERAISAKNFQKISKQIIKSILKGGVIIFPSDTVYGLICDATNEKAVKKLFGIKKRTFQKPTPVFIRNIKIAKKIAKIDGKTEEFLKKIWPGKVTVVLKAKKKFPKGVLGKNNSIGLRIPRYKILNKLLSIINCPLSATSANISGKPASTKIKEVIKQFEDKKPQPDFIIDAGNLKPSKLSTVVDLTSSKIKILRVGAIKKETLQKLFQF